MATITALSTVTAVFLLGIAGCFGIRRLKRPKLRIKKLQKSAPPQTYFDKYAKRSDLLKAGYPKDPPPSNNSVSSDSPSTEK
ncbi:MAG: hypothetical protein ACE15F_12995 [bacterium]